MDTFPRQKLRRRAANRAQRKFQRQMPLQEDKITRGQARLSDQQRSRCKLSAAYAVSRASWKNGTFSRGRHRCQITGLCPRRSHAVAATTGQENNRTRSAESSCANPRPGRESVLGLTGKLRVACGWSKASKFPR